MGGYRLVVRVGWRRSTCCLLCVGVALLAPLASLRVALDVVSRCRRGALGLSGGFHVWAFVCVVVESITGMPSRWGAA